MALIKDSWLAEEKLRKSIYIPDSGVAPFGAAPSVLTTSGVFSGFPPETRRKHFSTDSDGLWDETNRIPAPAGWDVFQVGGWELRQASEGSVYYQLLVLALQADASALAEKTVPVYFSKEEMMKRMGSRGGSQVVAMLKALNRMSSATFHIEAQGEGAKRVWHDNLLGYEGHLSASNSRFKVTLTGSLAELFSGGATRLNLLERAALTDDLALWLHGYYSQHAKPFEVKQTSLQLWSGRAREQPSKFRKALTRALENLCEVTGWTYDIVDGRVVVDRKLPSRKAKEEKEKTTPAATQPAQAPALPAQAAKKAQEAPADVATAVASKPVRRKPKKSDCLWSMGSTAAELLALGKKAFVASGEYGTPGVKYQLTSIEETAFEVQLAGMGRLSAKQKMEQLYDFLLESRAAGAGSDCDI